MTSALFISILATGFAVAFFHAAIPTHWLAFVLVGRGQHWSAGKTLTVTALAGIGHVLFTVVLGLVLVGAGIALQSWIGDIFPYIAGGVLIALGLFYLVRQAFGLGRAHRHGHAHEPGADGVSPPPRYGSDRAAVLGLITLLTFSPCEAFLPVYLSGIRYGWSAFAGLSLVLAVATLAGMMLFTGLSIIGARKLRLERLERYESALLGAVLCGLGVAIMVLEQ